MMQSFPDVLRGVVLFEIVVVIVFSVASMVFYIKRLLRNRNMETGLTWHVVIIAAVFLVLCIDRFHWVIGRLGYPDLTPQMLMYLVIFAAAGFAQYLIYARQIVRLNRGG